jgi:hypothetical protein
MKVNNSAACENRRRTSCAPHSVISDDGIGVKAAETGESDAQKRNKEGSARDGTVDVLATSPAPYRAAERESMAGEQATKEWRFTDERQTCAPDADRIAIHNYTPTNYCRPPTREAAFHPAVSYADTSG